MEQALQEEACCFPAPSPTLQLSLLVPCLRCLDSSPDQAQTPPAQNARPIVVLTCVSAAPPLPSPRSWWQLAACLATEPT